MSYSLLRLFTQSDLDRITAAVKAAESQTSGEIVPYVVEQSDTYEDAIWRGGFLFALAALSIFVVIRKLTNLWLPFDLAGFALLTLIAGGAGLLLVNFIRPLKRWLAGSELIDRRISQRAAEAFIAEEVFNTRDRTGILIFLSLFERKVLVMGDSGINAKVAQFEWDDIVQRIVAGIRSGKPADGLIDAIHHCGLLLQKQGVTRRPDDTDELSDILRMGDKL